MTDDKPLSALSWLKETPCNDCNFISALKNATVEELRAALAYRVDRPKNKTAVLAIEREIRKRGVRE